MSLEIKQDVEQIKTSERSGGLNQQLKFESTSKTLPPPPLPPQPLAPVPVLQPQVSYFPPQNFLQPYSNPYSIVDALKNIGVI